MIFTSCDHEVLSTLFNKPGYAGYKPTVREAPNGDGIVDQGKRYLHIALKYNPPPWAIAYLAHAHFEACRIAEALDVPNAFYPRVENGTLRVLDYPPNTGSTVHTDFDLFTVMCWRTPLSAFKAAVVDSRAAAIDPHCHIGQLGDLVGLGKATPHSVSPLLVRQRSIIYFAMPAGAARLPNGITVNEWLADRYARSRVYG